MVGKVTISPHDQNRIREACSKSGKDPALMISTANKIATRNANEGKNTTIHTTKGGTVSFSTDSDSGTGYACAANSLSILFRGWLWNGYSMDDAFASIRGVAHHMNVSEESLAIKLFGGINQVGINLRKLTRDQKGGLADMLDSFYVDTIIPEVYSGTFFGKAYLRLLTSYLGAGFLDGAHEAARQYWTDKTKSGSLLVDYVKHIFKESDPFGRNPSIAKGLRALDPEELEMSLNLKRLRPEKGIAAKIYETGLRIGEYMQGRLNHITEKRAVEKMRDLIKSGSPETFAYPGQYMQGTISIYDAQIPCINMAEITAEPLIESSIPVWIPAGYASV